MHCRKVRAPKHMDCLPEYFTFDPTIAIEGRKESQFPQSDDNVFDVKYSETLITWSDTETGEELF